MIDETTILEQINQRIEYYDKMQIDAVTNYAYALAKNIKPELYWIRDMITKERKQMTTDFVKALEILDDLEKKYRDERDGYLVAAQCKQCSCEAGDFSTSFALVGKTLACENRLQVLQELRIAILVEQKKREANDGPKSETVG